MTSSSAVLALPVWRGLRLGPLRLTAYGICAAAGLLLGMSLAGRAARRTGLNPEAAWDAGLVAVIGCFLASRLLLIFGDPAALVRYPLLVLGMPSLTVGGMGLAALMLLAYLRVKKLPLLRMLDAFAAPAAVLAAWLEVGHWLDGSEVGMPTALPWGVRDAALAAGVRVQPVALYGVVLSLLLAAVLWRLLFKGVARGCVAAVGLMAGGLCAFGLDTITQPTARLIDLGLEPGEWMAAGAMLAGALLWSFAPAVDARVAAPMLDLRDAAEVQAMTIAEAASGTTGEVR